MKPIFLAFLIVLLIKPSCQTMSAVANAILKPDGSADALSSNNSTTTATKIAVSSTATVKQTTTVQSLLNLNASSTGSSISGSTPTISGNTVSETLSIASVTIPVTISATTAKSTAVTSLPSTSTAHFESSRTGILTSTVVTSKTQETSSVTVTTVIPSTTTKTESETGLTTVDSCSAVSGCQASEKCIPTTKWNNLLAEPMSCFQGQCVSSVAIGTSSLKRFGEACSSDQTCYSAFCDPYTYKCSCGGLPFVPQWSINSQTTPPSLIYGEACISYSTTVTNPGQSCTNSVRGVLGGVVCDTSSVCLTCPEHRNIGAVSPTCKALAISSIISTSSKCSCGYLATCISVDGDQTHTCICPPGYVLHANRIDCYGWKTTSLGKCSVTCGSGSQTVEQACDVSPTLTATCLTSLKTASQPCNAGIRCPYDDNLLKYMIDICFSTGVITESIFEKYISTPLRNNVASAINGICKTKTSFASCCPGKTWSDSLVGTYLEPTGVNVFEPYKSLENRFCFGLLVQPSSSNTFCASAPSLIIRRKRAINDSTTLDQTTLQEMATTSSFVSGVNSAIAAVDPSASVSADNITLAGSGLTTQPTSSPSTTVNGTVMVTTTSQSLFDDSEYLLINGAYVKKWVFSLALLLAVFCCIGIIVGMVYFIKRYRKHLAQVGELNDLDGDPIRAKLRSLGARRSVIHEELTSAFAACKWKAIAHTPRGGSPVEFLVGADQPAEPKLSAGRAVTSMFLRKPSPEMRRAIQSRRRMSKSSQWPTENKNSGVIKRGAFTIHTEGSQLASTSSSFAKLLRLHQAPKLEDINETNNCDVENGKTKEARF